MVDEKLDSFLENNQAEDEGDVYAWDDRKTSFSGNAQFDEELSSTLNDILALPEIFIPFDDDMRMFCEEIEDLNEEKLFDGKKKGLIGDKLWAVLAWFFLIFIGFGDDKWTHDSLMQHIQSVILKSTEEVKMRDLTKSSPSDESPEQDMPQRQESNEIFQSRQKRISQRNTNNSSVDALTQYSRGKKKVKQSKKISIHTSEVLYTLEDLIIMAEIFYDIFSNGFQFKLMQWSFYDLDQIIVLEYPFIINIPRDLKQPPVPPETIEPDDTKRKGKNKKSKGEKSPRSDGGKTKDSRKKDEKSASQSKRSKKNKNAQTTGDDKESTLPENEENKPEDPSQNWEVDDNVYILPLQDAIGIDDDFFTQLFPKPEKKSGKNKEKKGKKEGKKKRK
ncbi:uncharacterized protein LOC124154204 isoform X2 [Ischnura elegans]|uniref:uncharacterized protein LOC124154204 isoform X2 n=1 Tax=Ischnura elegans TaxID=197161 RepID=UPI001ED8A47B|nr:uncharacterized protein LOC124154204 isoform X2 [Ischnura elegans]